MKNMTKTVFLFGILLTSILFVNCKNDKKPAPSTTDSTADAETKDEFVTKDPSVYVVAVKANPTVDPQVDICGNGGQCSGIICSASTSTQQSTESGQTNYTICVCFMNCNNTTETFSGTYTWDGNLEGTFSTGSLTADTGSSQSLALTANGATTKGSSGTLGFKDSDGNDLVSVTVSFE